MNADFSIPYGYNPKRGTFVAYGDNRHLITFGPTRSGKGATIIIPALLEVPHSIICIDPKGQNAAVTARRRRELHGETASDKRVHLLNPFDELGLGTSRFNPLGHLRIDQPNIVTDVRSLADSMIIPNPKDPHFTDGAVDLLHVIMLHLIATQGGTATLVNMREHLTRPLISPDQQTFIDLVAEMVQSQHGFIREIAGRFQTALESREIQSVMELTRFGGHL